MILKTCKVFETELVTFQTAVQDGTDVTPRRKPAFGRAETLSDSWRRSHVSVSTVAWMNCRMNRSGVPAVCRLVFVRKSVQSQTGKNEVTRPSRVCEPVQIDAEPVVLYCGLASQLCCQPAVLVGELTPDYQRASCTACIGARERIRRAEGVHSFFHRSFASAKKFVYLVTSARNNEI